MAQVNPLTREVLVKLVYYGPGLCGKTTSLQCIHAASPPEARGQIVSLATPVDRTLYFDFLPLRVTPVRDHHVRLQLFTVPGQVYFNSTRKLVLTGADGVVFVADSQRDRQDANLESLENLAANLQQQNRSLAEIPLVFQYNKRDLPNVLRVSEMERSLNALGVPSFPTSATRGDGVLDALDVLVQRVLEDLHAKNYFGESTEKIPEPRFGRAEVALEEQIGLASEQLWHVAPELLARGPSERPQVRVSQPPKPVAAPPSSPDEIQVSGAVSWAPLFGAHVEAVRALERYLVAGDIPSALECADSLIASIVREGRAALGAGELDTGAGVLLFGIAPSRWLAHRARLKAGRSGTALDLRQGLESFAIAVELACRLAG